MKDRYLAEQKRMAELKSSLREQEEAQEQRVAALAEAKDSLVALQTEVKLYYER